MPRILAISLSLLLLCSCATTPERSAIVPASELPADVQFNKDAGRGNWLFVTVRLESGEELPFFVDTGVTLSVLDKSLEPKMGKRLGSGTLWRFGTTQKVGIYAAPRLYLGSTRLITSKKILLHDLKEPSALSGRRVMGILGMDCLKHYCIQLDFEAETMRFLESHHLDTGQLGQAFPLTYRWNCPMIRQSALVGEQITNVWIDAGYAKDGALNAGLFRQKVEERTLRAQGEATNGSRFERAWLPNSVWNGQSYTNLIVGNESDLVGLRFLARHLVTFDFPKHTMYLKQRRASPLVDDDTEAASQFLKSLKAKGRLPGWPENDEGATYLEAQPDSQTYNFRKNGGSFTSHYRVIRGSKDQPWKLKNAWRTDQNDRFVEEYPLR